jgi:UDP-glucose 4-epimerase
VAQERLVLVTGGAGFIGSHLVEALLARGDSVRVLDNMSSGHAGNLECARDLPQGRFELLEGDVRDALLRGQAVQGVDTIFHQAALASVPRSVRDPLESQEVNGAATLGLLKDARDAGVRRVVYASSSSVYGESPELPKREEMIPDPRSPYAISKLTGELYCRIFHELYGMGCVALRYFNVFGPRQDPASEYAAVIPRFLDALTRGKTPVVVDLRRRADPRLHLHLRCGAGQPAGGGCG